jgi:hypothetical protein
MNQCDNYLTITNIFDNQGIVELVYSRVGKKLTQMEMFIFNMLSAL